MSRNDFNNTLSRGLAGVVLCIFWVILFYLSFLSAFCTVVISRFTEESFFLDDFFRRNVLTVLLLPPIFALVKRTAVCARFQRRIEEDERFFVRCRRALLALLFVLGLIWVLATQFVPGGDQAAIQTSVHALRVKDYPLFSDSGYFGKYPDQFGIVLICYLLSFLFGSRNYLLFQLLNVGALVLIYASLTEICAQAGMKRRTQLLVLLLGVAFFPLTMYCSFVYGNMPGLALSLAAIAEETRFFRQRKLRHAFLSAVCICLAILLKANYLIFLIGMLLYAAVRFLQSRDRRVPLMAVLLLAAVLIQAKGPAFLARRMTGQPFDQGASYWSWVAMGLQESNKAPGWFNSYNSNSYWESGANTQLHAAAARESIREREQVFRSDHDYALRFFTKKLASEYCDPSFQSFWIVQVRSSGIRMPDWVWRFTSTGSQRTWTVFLNRFQTLVYVFALLGTLCLFKSDERGFPVLAVIFIGGFLFHTVWEAKGQYTLPYYVLLFPYAALGMDCVSEQLLLLARGELGADRAAGGVKAALRRCLPLLILSVVTSVLLLHWYAGGRASYLTAEDAADYSAYLKKTDRSRVFPDGQYRICPPAAVGQGIAAAFDGDDGSGRAFLSGEPCGIGTVFYQGTTWLYLEHDGRRWCLSLSEETDGEEQGISLMPFDADSRAQQWQIKRAAGIDGVYIIYGSTDVLSYDAETGRLYLSTFEKKENQIWDFQPVSDG